MLIEKRSKYYLKRICAKAKMYEYNIPSELHGNTEEGVVDLIISAIAIIGDFSEDIINSINGRELEFKEYQDNLRFAAKFFDESVESKLYFGNNRDYYLLMGSVVYYLSDYNGSSRVLAYKVEDSINLGVSGIDYVLMQILRGNTEIKCGDNHKVLCKIVRNYNDFLKTGVYEEFDSLKVFRRTIYEIGNDREILLVDALIATIYLKVNNSSYRLMQKYSEVDSYIWKSILQKGTLITELWQSQRELGTEGVFKGESAIVQMPTGSGKTKSIALIVLSAFLSQRTNCAIIVCPFRALCREIADELSYDFSFNKNIHVNELSDVLQMDVLDVLFEKELNEQYIYVVTPEKLLYMLRQDIKSLANVGLMVFDEGHLFDDSERGITYELLISTIKYYISEDVQKVLISAVISNADDINGWLTDEKGKVIRNNVLRTSEKTVAIAEVEVKKNIKNIKDYKKYVYLHFIDPENPDEEQFYVPRVIAENNIDKINKERKQRVFPEINNGKNDHRNDMAIAFAVNVCVNGGTVIFCGRKDTADKILERILDIKNRHYDISNILKCADEEEILKLSKLISENFGEENVYYKASKVGVFAHHGDVPMGIRCSIEYAMQNKLIGFLACTSTLAQGVNLPIRYLIISNVYQGKERIKVRDFQNLIGRAGRAGIYTEGSIIISETGVYRYKDSCYNNWKWCNYKKLLDSKQAESCTSELLSWLRVDDEMEEYLEGIIHIFEEHYAIGNFEEQINIFLEYLKLKKEASYSKAESIVRQMLKNIEAIESFLLFYLTDATYHESRETIHDIIKETLAYYLANDKERNRLLYIVDLIGAFIVQVVNTPDKRNRYSKSLLGVRKEIQIDQWVDQHIIDILGCNSEEELLKVIFPLLYTYCDSRIKSYNDIEKIINIGLYWINGKSYVEIVNYARENNVMILKRKKKVLFSLNEVIKTCDNFFGYDCTLVIAAIIENVKYEYKGSNIIDIFRLLSKRMRYGLNNQCSILLFEMGFNDRVISEKLSDILQCSYKVNKRKDILNILKKDATIKNNILLYIKDYPSYFENKLEKLYESFR